MHDQPDLFDGLESRAARDAGIASVLDHYAGWKDRALAMIVTLPRHTGPFEDWRRMLREAGLSEPPDFHAWGGLSNACQKAKILVRTGRFVHMRAVRSHARITPELTTGEGYGCG
jgi:hypothetical protein